MGERYQGGKFLLNGKEYPIYGGVNPIGRNRGSVISMKNLSISQNHAQFILIDDDLQFVCDLNSSNGTYLNGNRLEPYQIYQLSDGSKIKFADIEGCYFKSTANSPRLQPPIDSNNSSQNFDKDTQNIETNSGKNNYISTQFLEQIASDIEKRHEDITQNINIESNQKVNSSYIPTLVLAQVSSALEKSILKTQEVQELTKSSNIDEFQIYSNGNQTNSICGLNVQTSNNFNIHEAETQRIEIPQKLSIHEQETEVINEDNSSHLLDPKLDNELHQNSLNGCATQDTDIVQPLRLNKKFFENFLCTNEKKTEEQEEFRNNSIEREICTNTEIPSEENVESDKLEQLSLNKNERLDSDEVEFSYKNVSFSSQNKRVGKKLNNSNELHSNTYSEEDDDLDEIQPTGKYKNFINKELSSQVEEDTSQNNISELKDHEETSVSLDNTENCSLTKVDKLRKSYDFFNLSQTYDSDTGSEDSVDFLAMVNKEKLSRINEDDNLKENDEKRLLCNGDETKTNSIENLDDSEVFNSSEIKVSFNLSKLEESRNGNGLVIDETVIENDMNDSDVIPCSQPASKSRILSFNSQITSKSQASEESFHLGLTQLINDDKDTRNSSKLDDKTQGDVSTYNKMDEKVEEITNKKKSPENQNEDTIFFAPTQKLRNGNQEISQNPVTDKAEFVEDIYDVATQKLATGENSISSPKETVDRDEVKIQLNRSDEDIFSTQKTPESSPNKHLESQLENMFASQKPKLDDSFEKMKDAVFKPPIIDSKLPAETHDLEAILQTQQILTSPKTDLKTDTDEALLGLSIESQLEVLFSTQTTSKLPEDTVNRPSNPLVNILSEESPEIKYDLKEVVVKLTNHHFENDKRLGNVSKRTTRSRSISEVSSEITQETLKSSLRNTRRRQASDLSTSERGETIKMSKRLKKTEDEEVKMEEKHDEDTETKSETQNIRKMRVSFEPICTPVETNKRRKKDEAKDENTEIEEETVQKGKTRKPTKKRKIEENLKEETAISNSRTTRRRPVSNASASNRVNNKKLKSNEEIKSETIKEEIEDEPPKEKKRGNNRTPSRTEKKEVGKTMASTKRKTRQCKMNDEDESENNDITSKNEPKSKRKDFANNSNCESIASSSSFFDSPGRNRRRTKPKVIFTMLEDSLLESAIKRLGGSIVDTVQASTILVTNSVQRTAKLLSAIGLSKPICSAEWIEASKKENLFLEPWDFLLIDKKAEEKWNFSLRTSLERSSKKKLFDGLNFHILTNTSLDVLKGAIESCGGKIITRSLKSVENVVVIATLENKGKYSKLIKQNPDIKIIEPEAIFDGVLRQEIRFEKYLLK